MISSQEKKRPNILIITSDQQHWNTIGAFNPEISTPHLDRLVKEGTTFMRAYCPNPTCTPSRASIITGQYPSQHGAWTLGTKLPEDSHTMGDEFCKAGYRTALVGKAHFQQAIQSEQYPSLECPPLLHDLDFWRSFDKPYYGFEHTELLRNHAHEHLVGQHYAAWLEDKCGDEWRKYYAEPTGQLPGDTEHQWNIPEELHYNNWIAERTNALIESYQAAGERFCLWASFPDPHPPYLAPEPWCSMYDPEKVTVPAIVPGEHANNPPHFALTQQENPDFSAYRESGYGIHGFHSHLRPQELLKKDISVYYGMVSMMDACIGKMLNKLDKLGLADDTIVVFTTDHGHFYGHHGLTAKGAFHYEDLIKLPFIVRYPERVPAGVTSDAMQSLVDLAPTFLSLAGIPVPRTMTGKDQSAVWLGEHKKARDHVICEFHHEPTSVHLKTYVNERYKLTVYFNQEYGELFDLQNDSQEISNRWADPAYEGIKSRLLMEMMWAEMGKEPMWMPRVAGA